KITTLEKKPSPPSKKQDVPKAPPPSPHGELDAKERYLICQLCGDKLPFNPICTCSLGEHLVKKHPGVDMTHFVVEDSSFCDCDSDSVQGKSTNTSTIIVQECFVGVESSAMASTAGGGSLSSRSRLMGLCKRRADNKEMFKTTVETWKPGPMRIICPACGKEDRPCIRKQRNKVAYTQLGAMCMVSCWPICFLPFLMPQASDIHLYCKHCGAFVGEYDRKTGNLKPGGASKENKKLNVPSGLC
ncbi:hypothetical protein NQ315_001293, partial [Exocentrus adspersus]